jgi:type IV secretory pathway VirB10-like protein
MRFFAMKKHILCLCAILSSLIFPAVGNTDYTIHLRHGGRFSTSQYWEKNNEIRFFNNGGVVGIEKNFVLKIEKQPADPYRDAYVAKPAPPPPPAKPVPAAATGEKQATVAPEAEEKVDIPAYKDRKAVMMVELNEITERLREATLKKDEAEKERLKEEMRKSSTQIYGLTDEVTKKNKGKLPEGWW